MTRSVLKADLHVHSRYSTRPSQWILQKIGCPECFTNPLQIYNQARQAGMDLVTITDHNRINGCLDIAHLSDVFISEEITTYFPEDKCKLHVLAYNITESQHLEFQKLRENIFDLTAYLQQQNIVHVLAHPLFAVNDRLTVKHFEQCLVLFNVFELNGTRDQMQNQVLTDILNNLDKQKIAELADKHEITPWGKNPWKKGFSGGSDDHSSLNIANVYTQVEGATNIEQFLQQLQNRRGQALGASATPKTMARNLYGIAYQFYRSRDSSFQKSKTPCIEFADQILRNPHEKEIGLLGRLQEFIGRKRTSFYCKYSSSSSVQEVLLKEATLLVQNDPGFRDVLQGGVTDSVRLENELFRFVSQATDKMFSHFADRVLSSVVGANIFDIFHTIGAAGSLYTLLAPYFVGYGLFAREQTFCRKCQQAFDLESAENNFKLAHFTDTFSDINGVAHTIRKQVEIAGKYDKKMCVVTCGQENSQPGVKVFKPIGSFDLPEYPGLDFVYPPFLKMISWCFEQNFELILAATPGAVGLAGLAISKIMRLPIHATYHTAFPEYVMSLTNDSSLEDAARRYMIWFYGQMDKVYAPSKATATDLIQMGIDEDKIQVYPRGVDTTLYHPAKRNGYFKKWFSSAPFKVLYVGRVSKEKNLHILAESFEKVCKQYADIQLIIVGEGPYLEEMQNKLKHKPATFTGALHGEELAQAYASADIFVFPSETDTFGNVVLEAQASGLPVIVTNLGGPSENIIPEQTGIIIPGSEPDLLAEKIIYLRENPEQLAKMRSDARNYMQGRSFDAAFLQTWELLQQSAA